MHRQLIIKAIEKAKKELGSSKKTHAAQHLSDFILEETGEPYGEKSLRGNYNKAKGNSEENIEFKNYVANSLSKYLGYGSYNHFLSENPKDETHLRNNFLSKANKKKTTIGSIIIAAFMAYFGYDMTKKDCMVWTDNSHFERIKCEGKSELKTITYDKVIFDNFKRVNPDCNFSFFKPDGSEDLWYGKSVPGELEFFTYHGLHPTTGKTLDPITQYMIDKYICKE